MSEQQSILSGLAKRGWIRGPDGSYSHPSARRAGVGPVAPAPTEQVAEKALVRRKEVKQRSEGRVALRVACVMYRHRLLDPDAIAFSMKPLTDAIAFSMGIDDADPRVAWEWSQVRTDGEEGVTVKIEATT